MYDLIKGGESRTYNQLEQAGVRRKAISPGIRAMESLGVIEVERNPFNARKQKPSASDRSKALIHATPAPPRGQRTETVLSHRGGDLHQRLPRKASGVG
jgi:hypothetical protein